LPWRKWTENGGAKLLSFVVAGGLWFTVTNRIEFEDTVEFPVEYANRPEGLTTIEPLPERIRARVHGKGKFLRYRMRDGLCRVDLSGFQIGQNRITFASEDVMLPEDVEVVRIEILEPRRVTVEFDEVVVRDVAIVPTIVGSPDPRAVQVGRTFLNPTRARVKGPRKLVDEIALVHTREIDIDGKRSTIRRQVRLVPSDSPTVEVTPAVVDVGITIEPIVSQRLTRVELRAADVLPGGLRAYFEPAEVAVEIEGPRSVVEVAGQERLVLSVDAERWVQGGRSALQVKEIRGSEIRFEEVVAAAETPPAEGEEPPPAAVRGPIVGRLALPADVEIVALAPDRLAVHVGAGGPSRPRGAP
jgi:hypothetical protein